MLDAENEQSVIKVVRPENAYLNVIEEFSMRRGEKDAHYAEWKRQRFEELMDVSREVDVLLDRRRNRKARGLT